MTAITLLIQAFENHMKEHKATFTVNVSSKLQASGKCNTCQTNFGVKG